MSAFMKSKDFWLFVFIFEALKHIDNNLTEVMDAININNKF